MKIIHSEWFTGSNVIGIVVGEDYVTEDRKAYIGIGVGVDEEDDEKLIATMGVPVSKESLQKIIDKL